MTEKNPTLQEAVRFLRNAVPEHYDQFVYLFREYTVQALESLADAPQDEVLQMQGRAKQCRALLRMFVDAAAEPKRPTA